ncbi:MAG: hypothetical protein GY913_04390 [Proteobacteria bacterium]|nr:hypothetical protein [Pseudomonadota bacterium]
MIPLTLLLACDQDGWGRPVTSAELLPWITAPVVSIEPQVPGSGDDLLAVVLVPADSSESAAPALALRWSLDGEPVDELDDAHVVPASFTAVGDAWSLAVVARSDEQESDEVSDHVLVGNRAPTLELQLVPEQPTTTDTVEAVVEVDDPDGEELEVEYRWFRDGIEVGGYQAAYVPPELTERGEDWLCLATTADGSAAQTQAWAGVQIANTAPTVDAAVVHPQPLTAETEATCIGLGEDDADGDDMDTAVVWTVDGAAFSDGETLPEGSVVRDQIVSCELTVSDEFGVGQTAVSAEVEVDNTPPTAPDVSIVPRSPHPGDPLLAVIEAPSEDADGDEITYTMTWTVDGATYGSGDEVPGADVQAGQLWTLTVTPSDGVEDGPPANDTSRVSG